MIIEIGQYKELIMINRGNFLQNVDIRICLSRYLRFDHHADPLFEPITTSGIISSTRVDDFILDIPSIDYVTHRAQ